MLKKKYLFALIALLCATKQINAGVIEGREAENIIYNGEIINPSVFDDTVENVWVKFKKRIYFCRAVFFDQNESKRPFFVCYYSDK